VSAIEHEYCAVRTGIVIIVQSKTQATIRNNTSGLVFSPSLPVSSLTSFTINVSSSLMVSIDLNGGVVY
jgi:hypothetical protein